MKSSISRTSHSGNEVAAETERLLVVEKVVLLKHAEHAAFGNHFHRFVQEEVGQLLVRQGPCIAS